MILLWGSSVESTFGAVVGQLTSRGADAVLLDQSNSQTSATMAVGIEGNRLSGELEVDGRSIRLSDVTAAYLRPYGASALGAAGEDPERRRRLAVAEGDALWGWSDATSALVVNRPRHMAANGSKPFQARALREAGFRVPETLVTTVPEAAEAFWRRHGRIVFKSLSGERSIVGTVEAYHDSVWASITTCPVQFQVHVPGTDFRVHTVGSRAFAARVDSEATDYRYPRLQDGETRVVPVRLEHSVESRCLELAHAQHLAVSGIDLRLTPTGEWFCFEVNPSPAFAYFDPYGEIAGAVAHLLMSPDPNFAYSF